jgi:hypothetical protein
MVALFLSFVPGTILGLAVTHASDRTGDVPMEVRPNGCSDSPRKELVAVLGICIGLPRRAEEQTYPPVHTRRVFAVEPVNRNSLQNINAQLTN